MCSTEWNVTHTYIHVYIAVTRMLASSSIYEKDMQGTFSFTFSRSFEIYSIYCTFHH